MSWCRRYLFTKDYAVDACWPFLSSPCTSPTSSVLKHMEQREEGKKVSFLHGIAVGREKSQPREQCIRLTPWSPLSRPLPLGLSVCPGFLLSTSCRHFSGIFVSEYYLLLGLAGVQSIYLSHPSLLENVWEYFRKCHGNTSKDSVDFPRAIWIPLIELLHFCKKLIFSCRESKEQSYRDGKYLPSSAHSIQGWPGQIPQSTRLNFCLSCGRLRPSYLSFALLSPRAFVL